MNHYKVLSLAYMPYCKLIQITKLKKVEYYYIGKKLGETKKEVKKSKGVGKFKGSANFCSPAKFRKLQNFTSCEISQGLEIFTTLAKLARLLLELFSYAIFLH